MSFLKMNTPIETSKIAAIFQMPAESIERHISEQEVLDNFTCYGESFLSSDYGAIAFDEIIFPNLAADVRTSKIFSFHGTGRRSFFMQQIFTIASMHELTKLAFLHNLLIHNPSCLFEKLPAGKTTLEVLKMVGGLPDGLIQRLLKIADADSDIPQDVRNEFRSTLGFENDASGDANQENPLSFIRV